MTKIHHVGHRSRLNRWWLIGLLAVIVAGGGLISPPASDAADISDRVVKAFVEAKGPDFELLPEEHELFGKAISRLSAAGRKPGRRMEVWKALQGLENGDASIAAKVLSDWYDEGDLAGPGAAKEVAVVVGLGDVRRAHGAYRKAMKQEPGNPANWYLLGHALARSGKNNLAEMAFQQVQLLSDLSGDQTYSARASARLGTLYMRSGKVDDAESHLKKAAKKLEQQGPSMEAASAYVGLAELYGKRAQEYLKKAVTTYTKLGADTEVTSTQLRLDQVNAALAQSKTVAAP